MRVICTGISGTERMALLDQVRAMAAQTGRDLRIFDVREVMFQIAEDIGEPVDEETILDMFPRALVLLRAAALEKIWSLCQQAGRDQDWIINTHAVFRWKNTLISGFDPYYLGRLKPNLYVTVTSGVLTVRDRLRRYPRWEDTSVADLLSWREEEQWATEEMARIYHKPQYLLGRGLPAQALFRLMFEPRVKSAYLSYPMQHAEGDRAVLAAFKARLEELVVVFDPADVDDLTIERPALGGLMDTDDLPRADAAAGRDVSATRLSHRRDHPAFDNGDRARASFSAPTGASPALGGPAAGASPAPDAETAVTPAPDSLATGSDAAAMREETFPGSIVSERDQRHIADQIVFRDYKLISQATMVVVLYDALVPSPGVISEMNYALQTGKRVYGVWLPDTEPSPFFTRYCTRVFRSEDDLFRYFQRYRIAGTGRTAPTR
ncbi:MAG: hypothetical protein IT305_07620 [Chloroflexi bacterium]|nr:hypothetical protein [Chloroflexota bacterium]